MGRDWDEQQAWKKKSVSEEETVPQAGLHLTAKALNLPPAEETSAEQVVE